MSESNLNLFTNLCSNLVQSAIITPIVQYLRTKHSIDVSVEELVQEINIPTARSTRTGTVALGGGILPSMATSVPLEKKKTDENTPTCPRIISEGKATQHVCGKPIKDGSEYCRTCAPKDNKMAAPKAALPKKSAPKKVAAKTELLPVQEVPTIDAKDYKPEKGWLIDINYNIAFTKDDLIAFAHVTDAGTPQEQTRPLTEEEEGIAKYLGLTVGNYSDYIQ